MNRSAWAARYRQLGRDAAFLLLSGPLSLLAFYLVVPLTALGVVTTIIWVGLLLLIIDLSIAGGFANIARLAVARVDGARRIPRARAGSLSASSALPAPARPPALDGSAVGRHLLPGLPHHLDHQRRVAGPGRGRSPRPHRRYHP